MPKVTRKVMTGQINGEGGREVEVTYDALIFAVFVPRRDLTAYELVQAHAVMGECRTFRDDEWQALDIAQRHWHLRSRGLSPGYIQHHSNTEELGTHMAEAGTRPGSLECDHVIAQAAALIVRWGGTDEAHHQQWVLDQVLRILMGTGYEEFIALIANWSEGIAP